MTVSFPFKNAYYLLLFLMAVINSAYGTEKDSISYPQEPVTDLYVSNTQIHITQNSVVALNGNLILEKGKIMGSGVLLMHNDAPQKMTSRQGYIENLSIDNPTAIKLDGDLKIGGKLVVKSGIFDISEASLFINPAHIKLLFGGSILKNKSPIFEKGTSTPMLPNSSFLFASTSTAPLSGNRIIKNLAENSPTFFTEKMFGTATFRLPIKPPNTAIV